MADNQEKESHWGECLENQILQMAAKFLCSDNPKCLCVLGLGYPSTTAVSCAQMEMRCRDEARILDYSRSLWRGLMDPGGC